MKQDHMTKRLALAGVLTAVAVAGSLLSVPVAGSKCAPVQHMVNVLAAVALGPWWGVGIAFCASLLRNLMGLGSLMAFPGSMVGALCCGLAYTKTRKVNLTCMAEAFGTGILGGLAAYPVAKLLMGANPAGLFVYDFHGGRQRPCFRPGYRHGKRPLPVTVPEGGAIRWSETYGYSNYRRRRRKSIA